MRASDYLKLLLEVYDPEYAQKRNFDPHVTNLTTTYDTEEEMMTAFDELPESIRDLVRRFPLKFSAVETLKYYRQYGEAQTLAFLQSGIENASTQLTLDAYGDEHPQAGGWDLDDVDMRNW